MWMHQVNRREFAEILSSPRGGDGIGATEFPPHSIETLPPDATLAIWPAAPREFGPLPSAVVVPSGGQRDFLAWAATYVRDYRPFTAFCRVIERPVAERFLAASPVPSLREREGVCSGLVLGESLAQSRGRIEFREFPTAAYPATLSYTLSRLLALTSSPAFFDTAVSLWSQVRELTGQPRTAVPPSSVASIWAIALGIPTEHRSTGTLFETANGVREAWNEVSTNGEVSERSWERLTSGVSEMARMREMTRLPRERRLDLVDSALPLIAAAGRDGNERWPFLAGYFTSLLSPGTLDHAGVLAPASGALPTAFLWYGLFASVISRGEGLPIGNPVARRIVRDLTIPDRVVDRPKCDIAFEELTMIGPGEGTMQLRSTKSGRLDVDIMPGVTMAVRWPPHDASGEQEMQRGREAEIQRILMEMDDTSMRSRHLTDRLRDILGVSERNRPAATRRNRGEKA